MNETNYREIKKRIAKLSKGKNVTWNCAHGKILLLLKIEITDINYDYILMAAFDYKKKPLSMGHSQYALEFECDENNFESVLKEALSIRKKIIQDAQDIIDCERRFETGENTDGFTKYP